jgi:hypothetical protein
MSSDDLIEGLQLDPTRLPVEIRELAPLIREWATGDEIQRSARLENASEETLCRLVEAVSPHWDFINSWLDEVNEQDPVPDEAVLLSWLADAAAEAETMID